ncbi:hypothetical protein E2C01_083763 [Portunus trituberculatus]|uniref:Uncharacterized protein n=1 Tax=Portunus trituberculatus TaxID=210409 RepID=A0A5B7IXZ7_PORTR|nr:hypothetical protein [Portunus trituberculatus]
MADTKGGLFAKTVQKHAGRAKEKVSVGVRTCSEVIRMEEQWTVRGASWYCRKGVIEAALVIVVVVVVVGQEQLVFCCPYLARAATTPVLMQTTLQDTTSLLAESHSAAALPLVIFGGSYLYRLWPAAARAIWDPLPMVDSTPGW